MRPPRVVFTLAPCQQQPVTLLILFACMQILNAALVGATESSTPMHVPVAKQLLAVGAAADTWAPSGLSALMIASSLNKVELMAALLRGGESAAQAASHGAVAGQPAAGADVHLADALGRTAVMHAAAHDQLEAAELLVEHGAQVWDFSCPLCCMQFCEHLPHLNTMHVAQVATDDM